MTFSIRNLRARTNRTIKNPVVKKRRAAFSPVAIEALEDRTVPAAIFWTGGGGDTNLGTGGNWQGGVAPGSADNAVFYNSGASQLTSNTVGAPITLQSVTVGNAAKAGAVTIGGTSTITWRRGRQTSIQARSTPAPARTLAPWAFTRRPARGRQRSALQSPWVPRSSGSTMQVPP